MKNQFRTNKLCNAEFGNISQLDLQKALKQITFMCDATRVGKEYRDSLLVAMVCIKKCMEEN